MSFTVSITQPTYLPWLGYFNLIAKSDVFVFLDTVQFEKQSWQSRNRIRTRKGEVKWLPVPIKSHDLNTTVENIEVASNRQIWKRKQLLTLEHSFGKAPFFKEAQSLYNTILKDNSYDLLADMNIEFIKCVVSAFGLKTKIVRCSELSVNGTQAELLLDICKYFKATQFYCNSGSSVYLESSRLDFKKEGVEITYQEWPHPEYQQSGDGFISHLSCLDAIACLGVDVTADMIRP